MSVVFFDGFDSYNGTNTTGMWDSLTRTVTFGRFTTSTGAFQADNNASGKTTKTLGVNYSRACIGMAINPASGTFNGNSASLTGLCQLLDGGTIQIDLCVNGLGQLVVRRNGTTIATSTMTLTPTSWCYIQWEIEISSSTTHNNIVTVYDSSGTNAFITIATGSNTQNSANAYFNKIILGTFATFSGGLCYIDDFYLMDTSDGSTPLGDVRVHTLLPNGNGNYSQFTNQAGTSTNNYLSVDEASANDDTDYTQDSTVGHRDSYAMGDLPSSVGTIFAVQLCPRMTKTDAGSRTVSPFVRLSGVDYDQPAVSLSGSYLYQPVILLNSPATTTAWTSAEINTIEAGIKVVS